MNLVSIGAEGDQVRLKRYVVNHGAKSACTHEGLYVPATITFMAIGYYRDYGAWQDQVIYGRPQPRHAALDTPKFAG